VTGRKPLGAPKRLSGRPTSLLGPQGANARIQSQLSESLVLARPPAVPERAGTAGKNRKGRVGQTVGRRPLLAQCGRPPCRLGLSASGSAIRFVLRMRGQQIDPVLAQAEAGFFVPRGSVGCWHRKLAADSVSPRQMCRRREGKLMRQSIVYFGLAALFALGIVLAESSAANAQSVMKQCGDQWKAAKAAGSVGLRA